MRTTVDRRQILQLVVAAALVPACGGESAPQGAVGDGGLDGGVDGAVPDAGVGVDASVADGAAEAGPVVSPLNPATLTQSAAFPLGISSGDPGTDRIAVAALWTGQGDLELRVWKVAANSELLAVVAQSVVVGDGGFVGVEVQGLEAGGNYRWAFIEMAAGAARARSPMAGFRTAPPADFLGPLRFAAVSCTNNSFQKTTLERAAADGSYDAFLLLGDTTYNDGAKTLAEFRAKWRSSLEDEGWKSMRSLCAVIGTWDDHEVTNDFNPETIDSAVLANARKTFFEHIPMRRAAPERIWRKLSFGRTADIFALDTRGERKPSTRGSSSPVYISREQMDWLKAGLKASPARFKLLMNSVPITDFPAIFDSAANDRWEGYAAQRTEILSFIDDERIGGVLWISGDFHMASVGRVSTAGAGSTQVEILVGPGAQTPNPVAFFAAAPQFDWATGASNLTTLDLDPAAGTIRCQWRGASSVLRDQTLRL